MEVRNKMTVKELFKQYYENAHRDNNGRFCIHGEISGGPGFYGFTGCTLKEHENVLYGHDFCPSPCKDFKCFDTKHLLRLFFIDYANNCNFYNETYEIDIDDPYYLSCYLDFTSLSWENVCKDFNI